MAHDDEEVTNPGRGPATRDFEHSDESEGTEEVTQVDSQKDRIDPDQLTPADPDLSPFQNLDEDTLIPD